MGAGKSTLGKKLAAKMGFDFQETDAEVEKVAGMTIKEIFAQYGETHFRKTEQTVLKELFQKENIVISTGGGTPCFFNNMDLMNEQGLTIYLMLSSKALVNRLKNAKNERPLLKGIEEEEMESFISAKLAEREPFYLLSKLHLQGLDLNVNNLYEYIRQFETSAGI